MKNNILKNYIWWFLIYTAAYILCIFILDDVLNGTMVDYFYLTLPDKFFYAIMKYREMLLGYIYGFGIVVISSIYIFYLQRLKSKENKQLFSEQQKQDMIVYLAHDLKTPLTSVIGYLTLIEENADLTVEQRSKYVGIALDKAYRLEQLINEFFDITRINVKDIITKKERVNLTILLMQVINEFFPMFEEKNISLLHTIEPELFVMADPDKLARVFDNLFRNAINYSHPNTEISCSAVKERKNIVFSIKNHGDNIADDKLERMFDKFYRVDSSRQSATGGAGLGLTFAKQVIELHDGTIKVNHVNGDTEFKITLPM